MRKRWAAVGTSAFFGVGPLVLAGVVPWRLTRWQVRPVPGGRPVRAVGALMASGGLITVVRAFSRFVTEGRGTPVPVAPPEHLVVGGPYRYVRNPMYVSVVSALTGQALLLGQPVLAVYAAGLALPVNAFVRLYEEPVLRRRFGTEYQEYSRNVPRWRPRLRPWSPALAGGHHAGAPRA